MKPTKTLAELVEDAYAWAAEELLANTLNPGRRAELKRQAQSAAGKRRKGQRKRTPAEKAAKAQEMRVWRDVQKQLRAATPGRR